MKIKYVLIFVFIIFGIFGTFGNFSTDPFSREIKDTVNVFADTANSIVERI